MAAVVEAFSCLRFAEKPLLLPLRDSGTWLTWATDSTPGTARTAAARRFCSATSSLLSILRKLRASRWKTSFSAATPLGRAATSWRTLTICRALARMARLSATCTATRMAPVLLRISAERMGRISMMFLCLYRMCLLRLELDGRRHLAGAPGWQQAGQDGGAN